LVLRWRERDEGDPRAAVSVAKAVGKAVVRNKLKRRLREIVRARSAELRVPCDLWLSAKASAADLTFGELEQQVERLLVGAGLWHARGKE